MAGGFQAGGGSEGWVVDASACPGVFFRPAAVWRGWLRGRQAQFRLQNNLAVGGWGVRNGCYDPLFGSDGGQFRGPLMLRGGLVLWLSAVAEDVLSQATDAQERYENQEDDDKDPEGAREEPKGLPLVFWAACVTTTLQSFRAGVEGSTRGCSLLEASRQGKQQGGHEAEDPGVRHPGRGATELPCGGEERRGRGRDLSHDSPPIGPCLGLGAELMHPGKGQPRRGREGRR